MQTGQLDGYDHADQPDALVKVADVGSVEHRERVEQRADDQEHEGGGGYDHPPPAPVQRPRVASAPGHRLLPLLQPQGRVAAMHRGEGYVIGRRVVRGHGHR